MNTIEGLTQEQLKFTIMKTAKQIEKMMKNESIIRNNGYFVEKAHGTILFGKEEDKRLVWICEYDKLQDAHKEVVCNMVKSYIIINALAASFSEMK